MQPILAILAGGRSSRFGSSKIEVSIRSRPLLRWHKERLTPHLPNWSFWLSLAPPQPGIPARLPPGADQFERHIFDPAPFEGPLAALEALLHAAPDEATLAVMPADMPLVPPPLLLRLADALIHTYAAVGVMARWISGPRAGEIEPFPSVWRVAAARDFLAQATAAGARGPRHLASWPDVLCIDIAQSDEPAYWGFNVPADLTRIEAWLAAHGG